jgi:MoaA/NifB/PqqE/SkfB family radical SAM enzyme
MANDLPENKSFCLAPWTHLHVLPDGKAMPCCFWSQAHIADDYGNINDYATAKDLMNHDGFKDLRKKFLKGEKHPGCDKCYNHEDNGRNNSSGRTWFNSTFNSEKTIQRVTNTEQDGTTDPNIVYLDIRFGNICNLKCRMCGYGLSSSWHEDVIKLDALEELIIMTTDPKNNGRGGQYYLTSDNPLSQVNRPKFIHVDCYDKIEPYIKFAEEIYFAGGEPMLYPEHTKILDNLIDSGNTKCRLRYNSNLSTLKNKGRDVVELWKNFESVEVGASIDAMQDGVEFIRSNLKWSVFEKNYNRIRTEAPEINLNPCPTIGILNAEIFPKFNRYCIENDWTKESTWFIPNFVHYPEEQNVKILPKGYKDNICALYEKHIEWIEERMKDPNIEYSGENQISGLKDCISYIREDINDGETNGILIDNLWKKLWAWKLVTPELDWTTQLPELYQFYMQYRKRHRGYKVRPN